MYGGHICFWAFLKFKAINTVVILMQYYNVPHIPNGLRQRNTYIPNMILFVGDLGL